MKKVYRLLLPALLVVSSQYVILAQNNCNNAVLIGSLPYSSGTRTTCGSVDDYAAGAYCNATYGNGEDYVFRLDITGAPIAWQFNLGGTATFKSASVHSACPPTPANCIGSMVTGAQNTASGTIGFPTNGTYYIIIDHLPAPTCGEFTLDIVAPPAGPANDNCANAVNLLPSASTTCQTPTSGTTVNATSFNTAPPCTGTADDDVWYSFVATSTFHTVIVTANTGFDPVLNLRAGNNCTTTTNLACADKTGAGGIESITYTGFTVGIRYYARVFSFFNGTGQGGFNICVTTPPQPPSNDNCSGPNGSPLLLLSFPACSVPVAATTQNASQYNTNCNGSNSDDDVWFTFTATGASQLVRFDGVTPISGTVSAMGLDLYTVCGGANSNCASSIPLTNGSGTGTLTGLTPGSVYLLRVWTNGANQGANFDVCLLDPTPSNDLCANAIILSAGQTNLDGNSNFATQSFAPEPCGSSTVGASDDDVWYKYLTSNSPPPITVTATPTGTDPIQDLVINIYQGNVCPSGAGAVACADATGAGAETAIVANPVANSTYFIRVYSWGATAAGQGTFSIALSTNALPIELSAFTGTANGPYNLLSWETQQEKDLQWHIVERSTNALNWSEIGRLPAQAGSPGPKNYHFEDRQPLAKAYYRLRSLDLDGTENISPSIALVRKVEGLVLTAAYPSPTTDEVLLQFNAPRESLLRLQVTDLAGRIVLEQALAAENGFNERSLSLLGLAKGVYSITLFADDLASAPIRVVKH